jgi:hypothetical protein
MRTRTLLITAVVVSMLGACRPKSPEAPPAPAPPEPEIISPGRPETSAQVAGQGNEAQMVAAVPGVSSAAAPASAAMSTKEPPPLESMQRARAGSKLGAAVDLLYQFDGEVETGRPVTLHLAAVPRVQGTNLTMSVQQADGIDAVALPVMAQKAGASQAYRQQLSLTRHAGAPEELRVLVTMDVAEGSSFGYYSVPLTANPAAH